MTRAGAERCARELFQTWMKTRPAGVYQSSIMSTEATRLVSMIADALDALPDTGEADGWRPDINLIITYHVVAYDESWGGYGDNASRDFKDEAAAVAYAQNLRSKLYPGGPRYEPIRVFKKMTMTPITVEIPFALPAPPNTGEG